MYVYVYIYVYMYMYVIFLFNLNNLAYNISDVLKFQQTNIQP